MYEKAREYLLKHDIRPSLQRMAIMEYLMTHKTHPTADEIFLALCTYIPTLSRTTVYNTVSMLVRCGAILALDIDSEKMHYDGDISPHAHFLCTRCDRIYDIFFDTTGWELMLAAAPPPPQAAVNSIQLSYKGLCAECNSHYNN